MIGKLKGLLSEVDGAVGFIETASGVYYHVYLTPAILKKQKVGKPIEIYTYLQVREDNLTLYGFEDRKQHQIFKLLLSVPGVGPKSAFTIVSHKASDVLSQAVAANNAEFFSGIPGIGRKTAQKIILELAHKMGTAFEFSSLALSSEDATVVEALGSLGFAKHEARRSLSQIDGKLSVEDKIKKAIKIMTQKTIPNHYGG